MYLWKIERLKKDLVEGSLPQTEQFKYLLAYSMLFALTAVPLVSYNNYDTAHGVATVMLTPFGMYFIYYSNGGGKGDRLLERYISLGWVMFIRLLAIFLFPAMMALAILSQLLHIESEGTDMPSVVLMVLIQIIYYYLLGRHVREVAGQPNQAL